jgi:hypothetical protein
MIGKDRRMKLLRTLIYVVLAGATLNSFADAVKDREGAVRNDKAAMESDPRWIYNDYKKGFAEAKRAGKPLLVVLRCVPCLACAGIDAEVLQQKELFPLLDQFVCVRVINANALDLNLFQFDYDLSFSTMFFNGDGTVYGRFGSWTHQKNAQDKDIASYKSALEGALAIHHGYPTNKAALAGKQGGPTPYQTPVEIPGLADKYSLELNWNGKVVPSCVHCHQIGDAFRTSYRDKKLKIPSELIYFWPGPETIGLTMAPDRMARVVAIASGSSAAVAGLKPGDDLVSLAGQPLISVADFSWALHHAPASGILPMVVNRDGEEKSASLALAAGWREKTEITGRVSAWPMRGMATGGLMLEDLADEKRSARGITQDGMALNIKNVGQYGKFAAGKNAGFQKDDVIVQISGLSNRMTESELLGYLLQNHQAGEKVNTTVLRGTERVELMLPMQ